MNEQRYFSTSVMARRLAVSSRTIRLWAECGELPAIKLGRQWRFEERSISEWILKHEDRYSNVPGKLRVDIQYPERKRRVDPIKSIPGKPSPF